MNKLIATVLLILIFRCGVYSQAVENTSDKSTWFKEAKFGMMVHWGLYSELAGSYKSYTLPNNELKHAKGWYAEWIQQRLEVPKSEYQALVKQFNPVKFDAEAWIRNAKLAGMNYFVITAKHHDGFALWDSKVSTYDIASTPYKKDILKQLALACKKYGIKLGFYYSHHQDWEHPGGALPDWLPQRSEKDFQKYWEEKCLPQVTELLMNYQPDMLWFDTWGDEQEKININEKRRDELIALVHRLSTKTLINGRISFLNPGNQVDFLEMMDNTYPSEIQKKPWQTPATMNNSWGYHAKDFAWKSTKEMLGYLIESCAKGGNYLLNIGPKADGTFPKVAVSRLRSMGAWLVANGDAIFNTEPAHLPVTKGVYFTKKRAKNGKTYIYANLVKSPESKLLTLPLNAEDIVKCSVLESGMPLVFKKINEQNSELTLPNQMLNPSLDLQVIVIEMKNKQ